MSVDKNSQTKIHSAKNEEAVQEFLAKNRACVCI